MQIQDEEEMRKEEQEAIQRMLAEIQIQGQEEMRKEEQEAMASIFSAIQHIAAERTMTLEHGWQDTAEKRTHEIQSMLQDSMTERVLMEMEASVSQPRVYLQPRLFPAGQFRRELDNGSRGEHATGAGPAEAAVISMETDAGPAQEIFTLSMKTPGPHVEIVKDSSEAAEGGICSYVELTYRDGAAADELGYAEEAANQIEDGTYAAHVGQYTGRSYWERPGYWNNRAVEDQGQSEMDARMFADAASRKKSGSNLPSVPPDLPPQLWEVRREADEELGAAESDIEVQQLPSGVVFLVEKQGFGIF